MNLEFRKIAFLGVLCLAILMMAACSDDAGGGGASNPGGGKQIIGENVFEWGIQIKYNSSSSVAFFAEPMSEENRKELQALWNNGNEHKQGTFGSVVLITGKKKGNNAELEGSFTVYNGSPSNSSDKVTIKGKYDIDELPSTDNSSYFIYTDQGFRNVEKSEWIAYRP